MSQEKVQIYEEFLINRETFEFQRKEFNENREYLRILNMIKSMDKVDQQVQKSLKKFCKSTQVDEALKKNLKTHMLLKMYDLASETEKKDMLSDLNKQFFRCKFDYSKPKELKYTEDLDSDSKADKINTYLSDEFKDKMTLQYQLELLYNNREFQYFEQIPIQYRNNIDFDKFDIVDNKDFLQRMINGMQIQKIHKCKNFIKFLIKYQQSYPNEVYLQNNIYNKLSYNQILDLIQNEQLQKDKNLFYNYLQQKVIVDDYDQKTKQEQIEYLEQISKEIYDHQMEQYYQECLEAIRLIIIYLNLQLGQKEILISKNNQEFIAKYVSKKNSKKDQSKIEQFNLSICESIEDELGPKIVKLIKEIVFDMHEIEYIIDTFQIEAKDQYDLKVEYYKYMLLKDQKQEEAQEFLSKSVYQEIRDQQILNVKTLEKKYDLNQEVKVELTIKNINKLLIKVYEIDAKTYLQNLLNENFITIDLTGFMAQKEYDVEFNESPFKKHTSQYSLDYIQEKKRGYFIVDFQGSILTSRVLIVKGQYQVIQNQNNDRQLQILDEKFEVCKGKDTKIWIQNQFINADEQTGEIIIPDTINQFNGNIILCHDDHYQLSNLNVTNLDNYSFNFVCYFNPESIQDNEKLKLELDLLFYQNNKLQSLSKLEDFLVVVNTYTLDNTDNQTTFKDIQPKDNENVNIEFLTPNELQSIKILVSFRIDFNGAKKDFSKVYQIYFNRRTNTNNILQVYLNQNDKDEYLLKCLGKNGESLGGLYLDFRFNQEFSTQMLETKLLSDQKGEIFLGSLNNVTRMQVLQNNSIIQTFYPNKNKSISYQQNMVFFREEEIKLPVQEDSQIELYKINENEQHIQKFDQNNYSIQNELLTIKNLDEGNYQLLINDTTIDLKIKEAKVINQDYNVAKSENKFLQKVQSSNYLQTKSEKNENEMKFKIISDNNSDYKVLLSQSSFLNYNNHQILNQYGQNDCQQLHQNNRDIQQTFQKNILSHQNECINDKDLSRELIYCQQRKNQQKMIGNTLQNPSLIILKQKQFEANEQKEGFKDEAKGNPFQRRLLKKSKQRARSQYKYGRAQQGCSGQIVPESYRDFQIFDFLNQRGELTQLKVDQNNEFVIKQEQLQNFGQNQLIVYHQGLVNIINLNQEFKQLQLKDLRLKESQKQHHILQSIRQVQFYDKNDSVTIQDLKNTQFYHIATQKQLFRTFRLLNNSNDLVQWTFLLQWNNKSLEDKMKFYQKFACTELNIFLYFKDQEFFQNYLYEFLSQKIEKTLTDYYLLDDTKNLEQYCCVSKIPNLKKIELIFLYQKMVEKKPEFCQRLYQYMKQNSQRINIPDKIQNVVIDNIILSKDKKQNQSDLQQSLNELKNLYRNLEFIQPVIQKGFQKQYDELYNNYGGEDDESCEEECEEECDYDCAPPPPMYQECNQNMTYQQRKNYLALSCDFNADDDELSEASLPGLVGSTNQYIEQQNKYEWSNTDLVEDIWLQILDHINENKDFKNFFHQSFVYSCFDISNILFFISIIDIDFKNETQIEKQQETLKITQQQNSVCISKQVKEVKGTVKQSNVNILQRFFDPQDQTYYDEESDETFDKEVKNFEKLKMYGSKLIITNFSNKNYNLSLNYQIPQGAISLLQLSHTKVQNIQIDSFQTKIVSFYFYFPDYGTFTVFPALLYKESQLMASAQIQKNIEVKPKEKKQDFQTVNDILESGDINTILFFVEQKNVMNSKILKLQNFYWLLKKEEFYKRLKQILKQKGVYDNNVWSFSIYHKDLEGFKEFLQYENNLSEFQQYVYLKCDLFEIKKFQIIEFYPLITARCHQFVEGESAIRNIKFLETYQEFIEYLVDKQDINQTDYILLANYLIAQNRYQEAKKIFNKVDREQITCKLQYDYINAYLKFILDFPDFEEVKNICESYIDFEFIEWKNLFIEILNQISEYEDKELIKNDLNQTKQKDTKKQVNKQKEFECKLEQDKIILTLQQSDQITVSFYQVEYEVLFSTDPFGLQQDLNSNYCKPCKIIQQQFNVDNNLFQQFEIAFDDIKDKNMIIQVQNDQNFKKNLLHIPCSMVILVNQEDSQIRVFDPVNQIPLSKVYVKTFIMNHNQSQVQFYKDGYTDIRGSFDYGKLNVTNLSNIKKFAILVLSENHGCKVQYVEGQKEEQKQFIKEKKMRGNYKAKKRAIVAKLKSKY